MLVEYRELYELQRRRLEGNVESLSSELQSWCDLSFSLAAKVMCIDVQLVQCLCVIV